MSTIVQSRAGSTLAVAAPATATVTLPSATSANGQLIIIVVSDATVATPAGFTLDASQVNSDGHYVFRKATTAGETSWTVTPNSAAPTSWFALEVRGLLVSSILAGTPATFGTSSPVGTVSPGSVTTSGAARGLLLASFGNSVPGGATATFDSYDNGFTEIGETTTTSTGTNVDLAVAMVQPTTDATYTVTATPSLGVKATAILIAYAGDPNALSTPVVTAGSTQSGLEPGDTITLTGSEIDTGGSAISARTWRQVSGAAVTVTGTGATASYVVPAAATAQTLVFGYTATNNTGTSAEATVTHTTIPSAGYLAGSPNAPLTFFTY